MTVHDDLDGVLSDLHQIDDMLRWAITQAWWPTSRALDAPTGRPLPPRHDDAGPDDIPGPRYALGVGDHSAQQAIRAAHRHLLAAESELYVTHTALVLAKQVPAQVPVRRHDPARIIGLVTELRWLTHTIRDTDPPAPAKPRVRRARNETDRAWRTLEAVLTRGSPGEADPATHAVAPRDLCVICQLRPRAPKKGKRCETCARFRTRAGYERPRTLDSVHDARDASTRRAQRGEGHGDESLAATSTPPVHDCTCTPGHRCPNHLTGRATPTPGCGTPTGYLTHQRRNQPACQACTQAWDDSRARLTALIDTRGLEAS